MKIPNSRLPKPVLCGGQAKSQSPKQRILVFNVNWRGDVLFSTPAIRAIKEAYPESYLAGIVPPRCREILEGNPYLDEIIVYDEKDKHRSTFGKLRFIKELRKKKFDTAFLFHRSFTRLLLVFLSGIRERVGYPIKRKGALLTRKVEISSLEGEIHKIDYFLNIVRAAGIKTPPDKKYQFFLSPEEERFAEEMLFREGIAPSDLLVVLNPGGNWLPKRWPKEYFSRLADELKRCYSVNPVRSKTPGASAPPEAGASNGVKIAITGSPSDLDLAKEIGAGLLPKPAILCGKTTLRQLGAVLKRANLVVAGDTGPMHIAVALNTPTIALFGPTNPRVTGPPGGGDENSAVVLKKDVGCETPCYDLTCRENRCMKAITPDAVMGIIREKGMLKS